ncbi:MAG: hypothetical protein LBM76_00285 [Mycoplasmataceae bacterium]|nr:hypothetical protein [Mycoplasmataceae bacterium]
MAKKNIKDKKIKKTKKAASKKVSKPVAKKSAKVVKTTTIDKASVEKNLKTVQKIYADLLLTIKTGKNEIIKDVTIKNQDKLLADLRKEIDKLHKLLGR